MSSGLQELPGNRPIILRNCTCPYCAVPLDDRNRTKEHVIGRRFVPVGSLDRRWNLILRACQGCNNRKSDLEDDIAAVSLQPTATGQYARPEGPYVADAQRRAAKTFSRRTRKLVRDSGEKLNIESAPMPGVRMTFDVRTQPQADKERVFELAQFHVRGFFYFITYDQLTRSGRFWRGEFIPLLFSPRTDWGNVVQRAFMNAVVEWEPQFLGGTADGMFKVIIRKHPGEEFFAWALEWNENMRVVGFIGEVDIATTIAGAFPKFNMSMVPQPDGSQIGFRIERALSQDDDRMFCWDDDATSRT